MFFFFYDPDLEPLRRPQMQAFVAGIDVLRTKHPTMTIGMLSTFLQSAQFEYEKPKLGADLKHIAEVLGVPYSTIARHSDILADGTARQAGLELVTKEAINGQRKQKAMLVTDKGKSLLRYLYNAVDPALNDPTRELTKAD